MFGAAFCPSPPSSLSPCWCRCPGKRRSCQRRRRQRRTRRSLTAARPLRRPRRRTSVSAGRRATGPQVAVPEVVVEPMTSKREPPKRIAREHVAPAPGPRRIAAPGAPPRVPAPPSRRHPTSSAATPGPQPGPGSLPQPPGQTITTVSGGRIRNEPAFTVQDLLQYSPGVSLKQGNGPRDSASRSAAQRPQRLWYPQHRRVRRRFPVTQPMASPAPTSPTRTPMAVSTSIGALRRRGSATMRPAARSTSAAGGR